MINSNTDAVKVERTAELQLTKKENDEQVNSAKTLAQTPSSLPLKNSTNNNNFFENNNATTSSPFSSLDRQRKHQQQRWWRRRSAGSNGKCSASSVVSAENVAPLSPALMPVSNPSIELTNSIITSTNTLGTRSKSSSRSGSSRSAMKIFKNAGSKSSQCSTSKAQIVSAASSSLSASLSHYQQKEMTNTNNRKSNANGLKLVHVHTLTKENIVVAVERKCQVWDVFHCCCIQLGIDDDRIFGLALRQPSEGFGGAEDKPRHEYYFLDPEQKISKYVLKQAKQSSSCSSSPALKLKNRITHNSGASSFYNQKPMIVVYMRVRVYVRRIDMISCDIALKHYYLQLRENLIDQWSGGPNSGASEEACWELVSLAILTDKGREWRLFNNIINDGNSVSQNNFLFRAEQYFPLWVINLRGLDYIQENMPKVLRGYGATNNVNLGGSNSLSSAGVSSSSASSPLTAASSALAAALNESEAMFQFCQEASRGPFALNCHLYGLRRLKSDIINNALIGITDRGIDLWDVSEHGERILLRSLAWNKVSRLSFDNKRITISSVDGFELSLYAETEFKTRYLLAFCREIHQQLIQINTNFVLNRPPTSPLLPPGWGLERLIDSSSSNTSLLHNFNKPEYSLGGISSFFNYPVYNSKTENAPLLISNSDNYTKFIDSTSSVSTTTVNTKTKSKVTGDLTKKFGAFKNRRDHVNYVGTPPPFSHKTIKQSSGLETDESDLENNIVSTNQIKKINNSNDVDQFSLTANEIVSAMNEAPSPPKFVLATETSAHTNSLQLKTKHHLPPPCLKQTKNISPNNASTNNLALYNSVLVNETNNLLLLDNTNVLTTLPISLINKTTQAIKSEQIRSPPQYAEAVEHLKRSIVSSSGDLVVTNASTIIADINESQKLGTFNQHLKPHLNQEIQTKLNNTNIISPVKQQQTTKIHKHIYSKSSALHKNKHLSHILQETEQQKSNFALQQFTAQKLVPNEYHQYQHLIHLPSSSHSLQHLPNNNYKTIDLNLLNQRDNQFYQQQQLNYEPKQWQSLLTNQSEPLVSFSQNKNYLLKYENVDDLSLNPETFYSFQLAKSEPKLNFDNQQKHNPTSLLSTGKNEENKQIIKRRYASRSPALNRGINRAKSMPSTASVYDETECLRNANINNNLIKDQIINKILKDTAYNNVNENNGSVTLLPSLQQAYKFQSNMMPIEYKTVNILSNSTTSINNNIPNKNCTSEYSNNNNYTANKITNETTKNLCEVKIGPPKYSKVIGSIDNIVALSTTTTSTTNQLINAEVTKKNSSCHFNETSLSNTEKFKNYPMMKALWEARHDLNTNNGIMNLSTNGSNNTLSVVDNNLKKETNNGEYAFETNFQQMSIDNCIPDLVTLPIKTTKAPPTYNQYKQQQQKQIMTEIKNTVSVPIYITATNTTTTTTHLLNNNIKVLDFPPPPPYPQNITSLLPPNFSASLPSNNIIQLSTTTSTLGLSPPPSSLQQSQPLTHKTASVVM